MNSVIKKVSTAALLSSVMVSNAMAANQVLDGANDARPDQTPETLTGQTGVFHTIANMLIFITGAVAVIMLIIGGLRYVVSQGDSGNVKQAKDTILYGVVGLIVAILAYAIVNFVAKSIT